jgi:hypothetical protein
MLEYNVIILVEMASAAQDSFSAPFKFFDKTNPKKQEFLTYETPYIIAESVSSDIVDLAGLDAIPFESIRGLNFAAVIKLLDLAELAEKNKTQIGPNVQTLLNAICLFGTNTTDDVDIQRQKAIIGLAHMVHGLCVLTYTGDSTNPEGAPPSLSDTIPKRYRWSVSTLDTSIVDANIVAAIGSILNEINQTYLKIPVVDAMITDKSSLVNTLKAPAQLFEAGGFLKTTSAAASGTPSYIASTGPARTPRTTGLSGTFSIPSRLPMRSIIFLGR